MQLDPGEERITDEVVHRVGLECGAVHCAFYSVWSGALPRCPGHGGVGPIEEVRGGAQVDDARHVRVRRAVHVGDGSDTAVSMPRRRTIFGERREGAGHEHEVARVLREALLRGVGRRRLATSQPVRVPLGRDHVENGAWVLVVGNGVDVAAVVPLVGPSMQSIIIPSRSREDSAPHDADFLAEHGVLALLVVRASAMCAMRRCSVIGLRFAICLSVRLMRVLSGGVHSPALVSSLP